MDETNPENPVLIGGQGHEQGATRQYSQKGSSVSTAATGTGNNPRLKEYLVERH